MIYIFAFFSSYFAGAIPFGFIVGKIKGIDIRKYGSKNIGATNVIRVVGKKEGILVFLLDFLKGFFPVYFLTKLNPYLGIIGAFAAILGHITTPFLKFKGGKGMATGFGALLGIAPFSVLLSFVIWIIVALLSRIVSLASIISAVFFPIFLYVMKLSGAKEYSLPVFIFSIFISVLIILRHHSNIKRLLERKEPKLSLKMTKGGVNSTLRKEGKNEEKNQGV